MYGGITNTLKTIYPVLTPVLHLDNQPIVCDDTILTNKEANSDDRTPCLADAEDTPKKDKGKGNADSDIDWGCNKEEGEDD